MTTRDTVESYFDALHRGSGWPDHLADDVVFTSHGTPVKHLTGREAYVDSTRGFYGMIESFEVKDLIVEGDRACAVTSYKLVSPLGDSFTSDVAEVFTVSDDRIDTFSIFFDATPFPS